MTDLNEPQRLSDYAVGIFIHTSSRKGIKKAIKKGLVFINDKRSYTGDFLKGKEKIDLYGELTDHQRIKPDIDIDIVYKDPFLAIINKPPGIVVSGNKARTLSHFVSYILEPSKEKDALPVPCSVHRLDYPTSGLVIFARTIKAMHGLNDLFSTRKIKKTYYAITIGDLREFGMIDNMLNGKKAVSHVELVSSVKSERFGQLNLCRLFPVTGRRHQLRIHMAELDTPILGDLKYGKKGLLLKGKGLYLMAQNLDFIHPITGKPIEVSLPITKKFKKIFPEFQE
ncbi:MAG: RluA family pseudouridine synthase [Saprospiraceae bacterium]|nr:RluA family pseudouridine synthase [Saprospiraceae bacterium]